MAAKSGGKVELSESYFRELKRRAGEGAKRGGRALVKRDSMAAAGLGSVALVGIGFFVMTMKQIRENKTLQKYWWAPAAILLVVGWWMRKRGNRFGLALMILGAVAGVYCYRHVRQSSETTDGPEISTENGTWFETPDGQNVFVPRESRAFAEGPIRAGDAERVAERIYRSAA